VIGAVERAVEVVEAQEGDGLAGLGRGGAERHDRGAEGEGGGTEADGRPTGDAADVEDGHGTGSWTRGEGDGEDSRGSERACAPGHHTPAGARRPPVSGIRYRTVIQRSSC